MTGDLIGVEIEERGDDVVVARLTGELDISVAESTGQRIAEAVPSSARGVVVDMTARVHGLERGLDAVRARAAGGEPPPELRVVAPRGRPVARVLEIVEFGAPRRSTRTWTRRWARWLRRGRSRRLADESEHRCVELLGALERQPCGASAAP